MMFGATGGKMLEEEEEDRPRINLMHILSSQQAHTRRQHDQLTFPLSPQPTRTHFTNAGGSRPWGSTRMATST
jgi:hypothetical protein